jgi:hypothetical protein
MSYEQRDNSGSLFKNERKDKDTHPDYTGNGMIDGREYWFSAWLKRDRNGKAFMSLAFKPKDVAQKEARKPDPISTERINDDLDDSIPF